MLALFGILAVFAAVIGGFLLERGNPYILLQPYEFLIVAGAAVGSVMVANRPAVIDRMGQGIVASFRQAARTPKVYLDHMRMLYEVFVYVQRAGTVELEPDIEDPERSKIFSNHPGFLADRATRDLVCDSLRMLVLGATSPQELDRLLNLDIEIQGRGRQETVHALSSVADSLPGLGIIAAVLGVVITMESIAGTPETVGPKVAAALVGTFLGVLLCYGLVGPLAARVDALNEAESQFHQVLRIAIVSFARGTSPILALEYARRCIPVELRPSFNEMDISVRRDARIPAVNKTALQETAHVDASSA